MNNQTESYIILKPLAERFSKIAKEMTDDEIKILIKEEFKKRINEVVDFSILSELIDDVINENEYEIRKLVYSSIENKLK